MILWLLEEKAVTQSSVQPHIFREYDIRGIVDRDLNSHVLEMLGKGIGTYLAEAGWTDICLSRDCRLTSSTYREALLRGLLSTGMRVTDLGICPTPVLYFSLFHLQKQGGIQITGSHNPKDHNGLKICAGTDSIYGQEIQKIRRILEKGRFKEDKGELLSYPIVADYIEHISKNISLARPVKVVVDAGNGTGGVVAVPILRKLGCDPVQLYCEMDGNFPNHHPDPTIPENLVDLKKKVAETKAELGISYDGDADRLGVIDDRGNILWGDRLMIIFSREILRENPGATIISEVKSSQILYDEIRKSGGNAIMWKTGHSLIKSKLKEEKALLAGEMSGHIFFAHRYFGFDDAIYASMRLLEIIASSKQKLSEMLAGLPEYPSTPEIRTDCTEEKKWEVVEKIRDEFSKKYPIVDVDGVRIQFPDGWGLVRASNTQAVLVTRYEGKDRQALERIRNEVESRLGVLLSSGK